MTTYEFAIHTDTNDVATIYTDELEQFLDSFDAEVIGVETNPMRRPELHGYPKLAGYIGPCWGGLTSNGDPIIRYEDHHAYLALSA